MNRDTLLLQPGYAVRECFHIVRLCVCLYVCLFVCLYIERIGLETLFFGQGQGHYGKIGYSDCQTPNSLAMINTWH